MAASPAGVVVDDARQTIPEPAEMFVAMIGTPTTRLPDASRRHGTGTEDGGFRAIMISTFFTDWFPVLA